MPFNSDSYYRNKAKRAAAVYMAEARKAEGPQRSHYVKLARSNWRIYLGYLRMSECAMDLKRFQRREITYQQFMEKWDPRKEFRNGN